METNAAGVMSIFSPGQVPVDWDQINKKIEGEKRAEEAPPDNRLEPTTSYFEFFSSRYPLILDFEEAVCLFYYRSKKKEARRFSSLHLSTFSPVLFSPTLKKHNRN